MALRDHLSTEQNIDVTTMHGIKGFLCAAFTACGVGIDAQDARFGKQCVQMLFYTLRATP